MKYLILFFMCYLMLFVNSTPSSSINVDPNLFPVAIIHINDFHSRFEETNLQSNVCKKDETCIGGLARTTTVVKNLLKEHAAANENPIYLNAGDNFQGSLWYKVLRWNVTSHLLNLLPADAMTLGNHEFDHGIDGVAPFIKALESPMLVANMDSSSEPRMQDLYVSSTVIDKYKQKIGVIGVIIQTTDQLSNTENLKFLDEIETVRTEAQQLHDDGIDIIIVLSHCGLEIDKEIAEKAGSYIDVIVGGHSHTFLYNGTSPGLDEPADTYPVIETQEDGRSVYIVQASSFTKYVGDFMVWFDENGDVVDYSGNPIYLSSDVEQDMEVLDAMKPWKEEVDKVGNKVFGQSLITLDNSNCQTRECIIGNIITDSYVNSFVPMASDDEWTYASIAIMQASGIRSPLEKGDLKYIDLLDVLPYENALIAFDIRGDKLLAALEYSVSENGSRQRNMLQVSGLKIIFNMTKPVGERIVSIKILCNSCSIPKYEQFDLFKNYRVIAQTFLANGADGFTWFRDFGTNKTTGSIDIDAFTSYITRITPIILDPQDRITFI